MKQNLTEVEFITNQRQQKCLEETKNSLINALIAAQNGEIQDLISIDVKSALMFISEVSGEEAPEENVSGEVELPDDETANDNETNEDETANEDDEENSTSSTVVGAIIAIVVVIAVVAIVSVLQKK